MAGTLLLATNACSEDEDFYIFLCFGQSNMEGYPGIPDVIPTAHVVSAKGCPDHDDNLHFTPEGYRILGKRYVDTMLPLLQAD